MVRILWDRLTWLNTAMAVTALAHSMTVVTRNVANFNDQGLSLLNPGN